MRAATKVIDGLSSFLSEKELENVSDWLDKRNRKFAQKVNVSDHEDFKSTCYHEAGEALVQNYLFPDYPTTKICVIEGDDAYGYNYDDTHKIRSRTREQMINQMASCFGGYCAEEIVFGTNKTTEGCEQDFKDAAKLAVKMVRKFYMGPEMPIKPISTLSKESIIVLGVKVGSRVKLQEQKFTKAQKRKFERFEKDLMNEAEQKARTIITENRASLDNLADSIMHNRILLREEIANVLSLGTP